MTEKRYEILQKTPMPKWLMLVSMPILWGMQFFKFLSDMIDRLGFRIIFGKMATIVFDVDVHYSDAQLEEIANKVSLLDVVGEKSVLYPGKERKDIYWGLCPFHKEKTPSFSVTPAKGVFYCFGCHKGGGLFQFVMMAEQCTFKSAVGKLAKRAGIDLLDRLGGNRV
jgi:hypothetical protein